MCHRRSGRSENITVGDAKEATMSSESENEKMTESKVSTQGMKVDAQSSSRKPGKGESELAPGRKSHRTKKAVKAERKPSTKTASKAEKLVCRYCGSDDLSPSFIRRRDARCRACFKKKYGSSARSKKSAGKSVKASK